LRQPIDAKLKFTWLQALGCNLFTEALSHWPRALIHHQEHISNAI
jgi:hypothetical protein